MKIAIELKNKKSPRWNGLFCLKSGYVISFLEWFS